MKNKLDTKVGLLIEEQQMMPIFNMLKANIVRSKTPITAIFLGVYSEGIVRLEDKEDIEEDITSFLNAQTRQTDILIKLSDPYQWCVILLQSKEEEATAFLSRLFQVVQNKKNWGSQAYHFAFSASVIEIRNSMIEYEELMSCGYRTLKSSLSQGDWHIEYVKDFKESALEHIRVSIVEGDEVFSRILTMSLENLPLNRINLEINTFQDGFEFLESEWHSSSHTHLVIMNDILSKKNGFEVLYNIRRWPNNKRFIIFMLTKRTTEEDMIFAFENGVDAYLAKPFNIRLFEAQVKGTLERLWK